MLRDELYVQIQIFRAVSELQERGRSITQGVADPVLQGLGRHRIENLRHIRGPEETAVQVRHHPLIREEDAAVHTLRQHELSVLIRLLLVIEVDRHLIAADTEVVRLVGELLRRRVFFLIDVSTGGTGKHEEHEKSDDHRHKALSTARLLPATRALMRIHRYSFPGHFFLLLLSASDPGARHPATELRTPGSGHATCCRKWRYPAAPDSRCAESSLISDDLLIQLRELRCLIGGDDRVEERIEISIQYLIDRVQR